jgi:PAS domain S-box-containing protein
MGKSSLQSNNTRRAVKLRLAVNGVLAAIVPPIAAFTLEMLFLSTPTRWLLFTAAVIVSSWLGGLKSGIAATFLSLSLVWAWYLLPPERSFSTVDPKYYFNAGLFIALGIAISVFHERLKRARREAADALVQARRANEALERTARERRIFAALIENSPDFIGIADPAGKPTYVNPAGRRMVELPDDRAIETTQIQDYYPPDVRPFVSHTILKAIREHGQWSGETYWRNWRTQEPISVSDTHFAIDDPETGQVIGMGTITRDISELKRTRDELEATNAQLRQTTTKLKEGQSFFQAVIDHSPGIIAVKNLEGNLLLFNRRFEQGLGASPGELNGKTVYDLFPEDVARRRKATDETVIKTGEPVTIEETVDLKDGTHVFLATVFPLRRESGSVFGVCWIETDITERKRAEEALRQTTRDLNESKYLLQAVFDHSPNAIVVKDLEGKFLLTNRRFEETVGIGKEALRGAEDHDLLPPADAERHLATDAAAIKSGRPVTTEETGLVQGKPHTFLETVFPLRDERGSAFGVCWIGTEITDIRRAEEALQRTANELKEAQRVAHIGSWSLDIKTKALQWSEELFRIHGRDPALSAPSLLEELPTLFTPQSMTLLTAGLQKVIKDGKPFEHELETILPEGSHRWIAVRGESVHDASGQLTGVRGTTQDITQLKQLQQLKDEWMSVIAHDLRQPIGVIKMAAELLPDLHVGKMGADEGTITQRIRSAANGLARMVDDLLDMSRIEARRLSLEQVWADPRSMLREALERLSHLTTGTHVAVTEAGSPSQIFVDPVRFDQILGNLMGNAVKHGAKNGEIRVHVEQRGGEVEISVTNQGRGIEPDELSRIFTRFARSKSTHKSEVPGLGLGLYIAKGLVEAHGGHMWVDSVPNKTTTFHFTLPSRVAAKEAA